MQIIGAFEETIAAQDGPFYGLSIIAQNFVFREIRAAGFKVALGGQGGDESFLGYRKFAIFALIDAWRRRSLVSVAVKSCYLPIRTWPQILSFDTLPTVGWSKLG
jgi:asparagine synthetase B (glutamine-hydrolysing)